MKAKLEAVIDKLIDLTISNHLKWVQISDPDAVGDIGRSGKWVIWN